MPKTSNHHPMTLTGIEYFKRQVAQKTRISESQGRMISGTKILPPGSVTGNSVLLQQAAANGINGGSQTVKTHATPSKLISHSVINRP
jgi:hypothetical protein